jgi:SAM-dependent methyltransferase
MKYLNLGCAARFHPDWENVDFSPAAPNVRAHDLRDGIPYPDGTFDVVYHSHVLEHFSKHAAPVFLRECYRVLSPGGVMRVAVPDLERIARLYLEALEKASRGILGWEANYEWMLLEMYDQAVRESSGGSCGEYYSRDPIPNWDFIYERVGAEAKAAHDWVRASRQASQNGPAGLGSRLKYALRNPAKFLRHKLARVFLSEKDYHALQIGQFRMQGEVHQWMYDSYSLSRLLRASGFRNPQQRGPKESLIPNWTEFHLDTATDGSTHKPDSLWMEATRP